MQVVKASDDSERDAVTDDRRIRLQVKWMLAFVVNCLRGVGQVFFANNPLSGVVILSGLVVQSPRVAIHGT